MTGETAVTPPAFNPERPAVRGTLLASAALTIMAGATIAPSLPAMREVFVGTPGAEVLVRLVLTITALAIALTAPLAGVFADRVGRRPLLVASLVLYALAGSAAYFMSDLYAILVTRFLLGVAVAGVSTAGAALIADYFEGPRRAGFLGLQGAFTSFGGVVMLPLGGLLAGLSWHAPFLVYLSALLIVPFALSAVRDVPRPRSPAPAPGTVPVAPPAVWPVYLLAFVTMLAFYMGPTQVPFVLAAVGVSPASMGLMIAISALAGGLTSLMYARLRARLTVGTLAALGLALLGAAWVLVGTADSLWQIVLGLLVNGVASGVLLPNFAVWLSALATPETRGRLLGGLTTAIFLGQFVSPLAAQPLVAIWDLSGAFVAVGLATMTLGGFMALRTRGRWAVAK